MWRRIERLCEWSGPRASSVRRMLDDKCATPAVLTFLRDKRVGRVVMLAPSEEEEGEGEDIKDEGSGEEAGPGPP